MCATVAAAAGFFLSLLTTDGVLWIEDSKFKQQKQWNKTAKEKIKQKHTHDKARK